jgi:hypothetical protein
LRTSSLEGVVKAGSPRERAARELSEQSSITTEVLRLSHHLGVVGDLLGREFSVYDSSGSLRYVVRQRPINLVQIQGLLHDARIMAAQDFLHELEESKKMKKK